MSRWLPALILLSLASGGPVAAKAVVDAPAVQILDRMSSVIGDLGSCSFRLRVENDVQDPDHGLITRLVTHDVHIVGPNKMLVDSRLDRGHHEYWYDGKNLSYYSYEEQNYAVVPAASTVLETIERVHRDYGVDFPAADFLYPTFTDDLIDDSDEIRFLGRKDVDGRECFHILAVSKTRRTQIWIATDAFNLPVRFSIIDTAEKGTPHYVGTFSDWKLNPDLPSAIFDFTPPPSAAKIRIMSKTAR